jgi:hypothetical protein
VILRVKKMIILIIIALCCPLISLQLPFFLRKDTEFSRLILERATLMKHVNQTLDLARKLLVLYEQKQKNAISPERKALYNKLVDDTRLVIEKLETVLKELH